MIKIACVGGEPCKNVINKCLQSIVNQSFKDWEMVVVLDPADYNIYCDDERVEIFINKDKQTSTGNLLDAVSKLKAKDEDILVFMDGDDWLEENALELVNNAYHNTDILVTHGSWSSFPSGWGGDNNRGKNNSNNPYKREEYIDLRQAKWHGSALRTMKYKVFKNISGSDFRNADGEYLVSGCDVALMLPALEMAGYDRVKFIKEKIYVYNVSGKRTPHTHRKESLSDYNYIKTKTPYSLLS